MKACNKNISHYFYGGFWGLVLVFLTAGCASLEGPPDPDDPLERYNRSMHSFNEVVDENLLKPVAEVYQEYTPEPVNKGISNFFSNLDDVLVFANDLFQLKFMQAASDLSRIFFNTTVGLFGFVDVASHLDMKKHKEDFGQTLGYWGVPAGPYFVMPFFGPGSIRDTTGFLLDSVYIDPVYSELDERESLGAIVLDAVNTRASLLLASKLLEQASLDPYVSLRDAYLQRRRYLVYDGDPPFEDFE